MKLEPTRIGSMAAAHHRLGDLDSGRADEDDEDAGEDEEDQRNHDLDRGLGSTFLGELPPFQSHRVGQDAECRRRCSNRTSRPG